MKVSSDDVWYSRRPEVADIAAKARASKTKRTIIRRWHRLAKIYEEERQLGNVICEPGTGIPLADLFRSVAQELKLRLRGTRVIDLTPGEPCPDPTRCFDL
jgi:hypothetical protein